MLLVKKIAVLFNYLEYMTYIALAGKSAHVKEILRRSIGYCKAISPVPR